MTPGRAGPLPWKRHEPRPVDLDSFVLSNRYSRSTWPAAAWTFCCVAAT